MPRRRGHRRKRKGCPISANATKKQNAAKSISDDMRACFEDGTHNKTTPISPLELVTPLRNTNPQVNITDPFKDDSSHISTTPVYRKLKADKSRKYSMNVTNLNILFDSNFVHNSSTSASDTSALIKKSPLLRTNRSTVLTPDDKKLELKKTNEISETPKVREVLLADKNKSEEMCNIPPLNNYGLINGTLRNNERNKFYNGEVNINPYLHSKEINMFSKNGSFAEISFFSPNLFQHKTSSTPIEKLQQANNIVDYLKNSLRKENVSGCSFIDKLDLVNNRDFPAVTKLNYNLNMNRSYLSEKVFHKEDHLKHLKMQSLNLGKWNSHKTSPKPSRILSHLGVFNKRHTLTNSRLNINRRSPVDNVESRHSRISVTEKLLNRLKKYARASRNWSTKVIDLCAQLGVQIKSSLSSLCKRHNVKSTLDSFTKHICSCEEYREEISHLNSKIEELTEEVRIVKSQIEEEKNNKENVNILGQEINKFKEEVTQFKELRAELETLKEQLNKLKCTSLVTPPPPPPPPPPMPYFIPPPPPLLPPLSTPNHNLPKVSKKNEVKSISHDNSRPIISLDDILKVKLKKASDRSNCSIPTTRRHSQPLVSMDMLRQVKLRPASRPSFCPDTPDTEASLASTSPHSSLCRLLNNDSPMFRIKRLKKVSRFGYESVHRRNMIAKRERSES